MILQVITIIKYTFQLLSKLFPIACMDNSQCKNGGLCEIDGNCKCRKFDPEITGVHCEGMQLKNAQFWSY